MLRHDAVGAAPFGAHDVADPFRPVLQGLVGVVPGIPDPLSSFPANAPVIRRAYQLADQSIGEPQLGGNLTDARLLAGGAILENVDADTLKTVVCPRQNENPLPQSSDGQCLPREERPQPLRYSSGFPAQRAYHRTRETGLRG